MMRLHRNIYKGLIILAIKELLFFITLATILGNIFYNKNIRNIQKNNILK